MKSCLGCGTVKPITDFYRHRGVPSSHCRICDCAKSKLFASKVKDDVFEAYGGYICSCCGETEPKFLTIDHIKNNGGSHRREDIAISKHLYRWLKNNHYPDGFQVLCMNCNLGKSRNDGVCPHKVSYVNDI
jgi:hypothetical protein